MRKTRLTTNLAALLAACAAGAPLLLPSSAPAAPAATIHVGGYTSGAPTSTKQGFLGLATSLSTIPGLSGTAANPDVPLDNAIEGLSPGAPPELRIGGNSADDSWWPSSGAVEQDKEKYLYKLSASWGTRVHSMLVRLGAKALVGVNLDLNNQVNAAVAKAEVTNFERYLGADRIDAFELGNEPEFFPLSIVTGPHGTGGHDTIPAYGKKFTQIAAQLGNVPLAGPGSVGPVWVGSLGAILSHLPSRLKVATVHAYAMQNCSRLAHLTVSDYFDTASIQGLAATVHSAVEAAAAHGKPLRIDELNGITCGGKAGMSNSFAEALWALNVLPALWQAGVQGVNFQSVDGGYNQMIIAHHTGSDWRVVVEPEYYGLLAFAQAAPAGSRLLKISTPGLADFYQFAVRAPGGAEHVVLTNVGAAARTIDVTAAGTHGQGSLALLTAPSLSATGGVTARRQGRFSTVTSTSAGGGVTLGGQHFSERTGRLAGVRHLARVAPGPGGYVVRVPPHSAAILTLAG